MAPPASSVALRRRGVFIASGRLRCRLAGVFSYLLAVMQARMGERRLEPETVRAVLTWDAVAKQSPGRLRPCANDQCHLFLIDHSKAGTAKWCSMAICGNRMKARRHYRKVRATAIS
jgi:predicted RNA-binding Zn ribbon-like protein